MSAWVTVACLLTLRSEFNALAPDRDKGADGTIGDAAHSPSSDHAPDEDSPVLRGRDPDSVNEVHALDIDVDLRVPGLPMERVVQHIVALQRAGDGRLRYVIFNRRIWQRDDGWREERYVGDDPHTNHAHFSASYVAAQERRTDTWHLEEIPVALTPEDKTWLATLVRNTVREELDKHSTEDGDTTARKYSRDGLITTIEQDTKKIRELLEAPTPTDPPA